MEKLGYFENIILENFVLQKSVEIVFVGNSSTTFELSWNENCVKLSMNARVQVWMQRVNNSSLGVTPV